MREINEIIIHCSATKEGEPFKAADIDLWHKRRGWVGIGYHYVIDLDGKIEVGRDEEKVGAHCYGHNKNSIGVCYIGGLDSCGKPKDTRTPAQIFSLKIIMLYLKARFPNAVVYGHNQLDPHKDCPCFSVPDFGY